MSNMIYVYKSIDGNNYIDRDLSKKKRLTEPCEICNEDNVTECCNKCGTGVCNNVKCSLKFPHRGNTVYSVCSICNQEIGAKLIPLIDLGKLRLLKYRIRTNSTCRSPRSLSTSSSSTSSTTLATNSEDIINMEF